jgi:hypothetical protein
MESRHMGMRIWRSSILKGWKSRTDFWFSFLYKRQTELTLCLSLEAERRAQASRLNTILHHYEQACTVYTRIIMPLLWLNTRAIFDELVNSVDSQLGQIQLHLRTPHWQRGWDPDIRDNHLGQSEQGQDRTDRTDCLPFFPERRSTSPSSDTGNRTQFSRFTLHKSTITTGRTPRTISELSSLSCGWIHLSRRMALTLRST